MRTARPQPGDTTRRRGAPGATRRAVRLAAGATALVVSVLGLTAPGGAASAAPAGGGSPAYPSVGKGTSFLDDAALLGSTDQKSWYEANIPFLEVPDQSIQSVYYYRWRVWKEHVRPTGTGNGSILTEFFGAPGYSAPYGAINGSSAHQMDEGRWLRDQAPVTDDIDYWLQGAGSGPKPATDALNSNQTDWAHEYSIWLASAVYAQAQVTGDFTQAERLLPELEKQYQGWSNQFNASLGMYWQVPVWDAMEYSASSYETDPSNPYHGGAGYRPTINAYQYGDAMAISHLAAMAGQPSVASHYAGLAASLQASTQKYLWDPSRQFFYDMARDNNPNNQLLSSREEIGFVPWMFEMPPATDSSAWAQLTDPQGFAAPYGPTTVEQRSQWYMYQAYQGCCRWDGPSWPFSTSQTLTGLANLLDDYPAQSYVTTADYDALLHTYAATQFANGVPHVGQAHDPYQADWMYDANDYNHSTFNDLVISGLIGVRPQAGDTVVVHPQVPAGWDYFALENVPYHGHNLTVLWDRTGSRYHQGPGMHVYLDGKQVASSPTVQAVTVPVNGAGTGTPGENFSDVAANTYGQGTPTAFASTSGSGTSPAAANDGQAIYSESQQASEWTDCGSPAPASTLGVDLGAPVPVSELRLYTWDNTAQGGNVAAPASYDVQYWTGATWADVPQQSADPAAPEPNTLNRVTFPPLTTSRVRVVLTDRPGDCSGVTEIEAGGPTTPGAHLYVGSPGSTSVSLAEGQPTTVTTTLDDPAATGTPAAVQLSAPAGWSVTHTGSPSPGVDTWSVTPAPGVGAGSQFSLYAWATAASPGKPAPVLAYGRTDADVAYSPAGYTSQLDDSFATDDLVSYTQIHPSVTSGTGEVAPTWTVGGGQASATASQPWFGDLASQVAPASGSSTDVVDLAALGSGATNHSSGVFLGLVKDPSNYVAVWYNTYYHSSGEDLVVNGVLQPPGFQVACCAGVDMKPGDRFAFSVDGNTITSWYQAGGAGPWTRLESTSVAPALDLTDPSVRSQYHFAFGLRGDSGPMAVSRFFAGSVPGA